MRAKSIALIVLIGGLAGAIALKECVFHYIPNSGAKTPERSHSTGSLSQNAEPERVVGGSRNIKSEPPHGTHDSQHDDLLQSKKGSGEHSDSGQAFSEGLAQELDALGFTYDESDKIIKAIAAEYAKQGAVINLTDTLNAIEKDLALSETRSKQLRNALMRTIAKVHGSISVEDFRECLHMRLGPEDPCVRDNGEELLEAVNGEYLSNRISDEISPDLKKRIHDITEKSVEICNISLDRAQHLFELSLSGCK